MDIYNHFYEQMLETRKKKPWAITREAITKFIRLNPPQESVGDIVDRIRRGK